MAAHGSRSDSFSGTFALWTPKGGVGKTTLTLIAAKSYAKKFPDRDVLIIDADAQMNLTVALCGEDPKEAAAIALRETSELDGIPAPECRHGRPKRGVYSFVGKAYQHGFRITSDEQGPPPNILDYTFRPHDIHQNADVCPPNVVLLPAHTTMECLVPCLQSWAETKDLVIKPGYKSHFGDVYGLFRRAINHARAQSNISAAFVDCNPSFLDVFTRMGLCAADKLVMPVKDDALSLYAFESVRRFLGCITTGTFSLMRFAEDQYFARGKDTVGEDAPRLPVVHGVIFNRVGPGVSADHPGPRGLQPAENVAVHVRRAANTERQVIEKFPSHNLRAAFGLFPADPHHDSWKTFQTRPNGRFFVFPFLDSGNVGCDPDAANYLQEWLVGL